ncbi:MAG: thymidine phosphorylase [Candidatus Krumholzibacteriia bacterium]
MNAYDLIRKKRSGLSLDEAELRWFVGAYLRGDVRDYQMAAFLMATAIKGMTAAETVALTRVMMESGRVFDFGGRGGPAIDKHSTGGVGDKISIPLVPIAAECGLRVPMISGRSLGVTGGTLDKLESIPGMRTDLDPDRFQRQVAELGACFGAQTAEIVPADRMLYALRDATATVESVPLIVSSILSKKFAEGLDGVVIDVKCGGGAFMRTLSEARELAAAFEAVGEAMGVPVKTVITAMNEPLGLAVGNALEAAGGDPHSRRRGSPRRNGPDVSARRRDASSRRACPRRSRGRVARSKRRRIGSRVREIRENRFGAGGAARSARARIRTSPRKGRLFVRGRLERIHRAHRCPGRRRGGAGDGWGEV